MYAAATFTHFEMTVVEGSEWADDHPLVKARPDLFTPKPPPKATASAKATKKES